jgi:outer membrane protein OmpA-like peptidoglycan-associated protein/tetratricopeptide (TPR) repeat protein
MKKNIILSLFLLSFLFTSYVSFSQNNSNNNYASAKADRLYSDLSYITALDAYKTAYQRDTSVLRIKERIAHCYRKLNDPKNAEFWYAQVVTHQSSDPSNKLYYAQALASNGNYKEAQIWFEAYSKAIKDDQRGREFAKAYENIGIYHRDSAFYKTRLAPFNSLGSDFSPAFFQNGIIFCSNRHSKGNQEFKWDKSSFLDLYFAQKQEINPSKFNKKLNSKYHEGPVAFFPTQDSIIFSRNNYHKGKYKNSQQGINKIKMYFAIYKNGKWTEETEFPYNNDEYSVGHPALTPDGKTLYFSSDKPDETLGGADIFVSRYENGKWTKPENLGDKINTSGDEKFPFIDSKGNLFFASSGHAGLGGLDVFMAENINGKFLYPFNLGSPINSSKDDFGLIWAKDLKTGYFSSNRETGMGDDDIYELIAYKIPGNFINLKGVVTNVETKERVPLATAKVILEQKTSLTTSNQKGLVEYTFNRNKNYEINIQKEGFEEGKFVISMDSLNRLTEKDTLVFALKPLKKGLTTINLVDEETERPVTGLLAVWERTKNVDFEEEEVKGTTKEDLEIGKYDLKVKAKGYFFQHSFLDVPKKEDQTITIRLKPLRKGSKLVVNSINFEFNSDKLTPDAKKEVDYVLNLMKEHQSLKIGVWAHTDSIGNQARNLELSNRRAKSVYTYLNSKGVPMEKMVYKGYGKSLPITSNKTPDGRAKNRRVEFEILEYVPEKEKNSEMDSLFDDKD